jgi:NAD(P)-dependent dehydrogenase (short-subunit alcohol dehydrogenase family)
MQIEGKVALVTGANRGIGAAIVDALVKAGARRVYAGMRRPVAAGANAAVVPIELDVTDGRRVAALGEQLDDVGILVNNAGVSRRESALAAPGLAAAEEQMRVNYLGTLSMARAFAPVLKRNGGGAIVNVLSILARISFPTVAGYCASKAAAYSLTQSLRFELAPQKTLVIGVMPGFVDTDMTSEVKGPKLPPAVVAADIVTALREGIENVYPGEANEIAKLLLREDPGAVAKAILEQLGRASATG